MLSLFLAIVLGGMQPVKAQFGDDPPTGPCNPLCDPDTGECPPLPPECIPIDGGLAFLLLAGVGYGVLKNRSQNSEGQNESTLPTAT